MIFVTKPGKEGMLLEQAVRKELAGHSDASNLVVAIGGDGTMLQAVKKYGDQDWPFLGIAAGRLGFLQSLEPEEIPGLGAALAKKAYTLISAPLLSVSSRDKVLGYAFNDVSIERAGSRAVRLEVNIDGSLGTFTGDGVLIATPLGSTAYNLAAGGPIIDANTKDVFVVTPNNPHVSLLYSSLQRPHVLSRGRCVAVHAEDSKERPVQVVIDGQCIKADLSAPLEIRLSEKCVRLVEMRPDQFHHRIQNKRLGQS